MVEINWSPGPLDRSAKFYVAGHSGMVGSAVWRHLESSGFTNLIGRRSSALNLRDRNAVIDFFENHRLPIERKAEA